MSAGIAIGTRTPPRGLRSPVPAALVALLDVLQEAMLGDGVAAGSACVESLQLDRLHAETNARDLSTVPSRLILILLEDERHENAAALLAHPPAAAVLAEVVALHRAVAAGAVPARGRWDVARAAAIRITDAARDPAVARTFSVVEAACWNPASARSVLVDTARPWLTNRLTHARQGFGRPCADVRRDRGPARRHDERLRATQRAGDAAVRDLVELCRRLIGDGTASREAWLPIPARPSGRPAAAS